MQWAPALKCFVISHKIFPKAYAYGFFHFSLQRGFLSEQQLQEGTHHLREILQKANQQKAVKASNVSLF